jgi:hypothetical protein
MNTAGLFRSQPGDPAAAFDSMPTPPGFAGFMGVRVQ